MDCSVKNANYEKVMTVIEKFLREGGVHPCSCQRCLNDVAAIALNYLPPHYYVQKYDGHELGSPWLMIETAVRDAIERVTETHHHDRQGKHDR